MDDRETYEVKKLDSARRSREQSLAGRDIGPIPAVQNPERRAAAEASLRAFAEAYFPDLFYLGWSKDQLRVLGKIESAATGGLLAMAMPRGSGKTTLCLIGALWATLTGRRRSVALIAATDALAKRLLATVKTQLEANLLLFEDWPEVCHPIRCLEGITQKAQAQLCGGKLTKMEWKEKQIVFPTIEGARTSGCVIGSAGLTGAIRGLNYQPQSGPLLRPELVLLDDPQTDTSARKPGQCDRREGIISSAVLGLAGPGKRITALMTCTVIAENDLSDRYLSRDRFPEWRGERCKMLYTFPERMDLWEEYWERRRIDLMNDGDGSGATEFYRSKQAEMDRGAVVAWPDNFEEGEISGLQHAMNRFFSSPQSFWSECQNEPRRPKEAQVITAVDIAKKVNGVPQAVVPLECTRLTAFIDVQRAMLFWAVCGWADDFTGAVIDYGTWPDQRTDRFSLDDCRYTIEREYPGMAIEAALTKALDDTCNHILRRKWQSQNSDVVLSVDRCLIDSGWQTSVVYERCRNSEHGSIILPSKGMFIGPERKPIENYRPQPGLEIGQHWMISRLDGRRAVRLVTFDTNRWKSLLFERLATPYGAKSSLALFGDDKHGDTHRLFASHLTAEYRTNKDGVDIWQPKPGGLDNHWLDCLVGCAVAASTRGCKVRTSDKPPTVKKKKPKPVNDDVDDRVTYIDL